MSAHFDLTQPDTNQCPASHTVLEPTQTRAGFIYTFIAEGLIFAIDVPPCKFAIREILTSDHRIAYPSLVSRYRAPPPT